VEEAGDETANKSVHIPTHKRLRALHPEPIPPLPHSLSKQPYVERLPPPPMLGPPIMNILHDFYDNDSLDCSMTATYIIHQAVG
jgi:hypothetical protein